MVKDKENCKCEGSEEQDVQTGENSYAMGWKTALAAALSIATATEWSKSRAFIDGLRKNESNSLLWVRFHDWRSAHEIADALANIASGASEVRLEEGKSKAKDSER